ncbi:MAG: hypothetical protein F6K65_32365 [Moorea sp. SIO3C2]|nr:hypothetical protein [Moorena sp. SIO3C2]
MGRWGDGEMERWENGKDFDRDYHTYEVQKVQSSVLPRLPIPDSRFPIPDSHEHKPLKFRVFFLHG